MFYINLRNQPSALFSVSMKRSAFSGLIQIDTKILITNDDIDYLTSMLNT